MNYLQQYLQRGGYDPRNFQPDAQPMPLQTQMQQPAETDEANPLPLQGGGTTGGEPQLWSGPESFARGDQGAIEGVGQGGNSMNMDWGSMLSQIMKMFGGG